MKTASRPKWIRARSGSLQMATPNGDWFVSMCGKGFAVKYVPFLPNEAGTVNLPLETTLAGAKRAAECCERNGGTQ